MSSGRNYFLTVAEVDKLLAACHPHLRPIVLCAVETGMRNSEILGLRWRDIREGVIYLSGDVTKNGEETGKSPYPLMVPKKKGRKELPPRAWAIAVAPGAASDPAALAVARAFPPDPVGGPSEPERRTRMKFGLAFASAITRSVWAWRRRTDA